MATCLRCTKVQKIKTKKGFRCRFCGWMRLFAIVMLTGMLAPARAQVTGSLRAVPLGYCQLAAISVATALSACSGGIPAGATAMAFQVTTTSARYRDDGTNPTAALGLPVATGITVFYAGTLSKFAIIPTAATSTIDILFYQIVAP
jgi:hypothetical protein